MVNKSILLADEEYLLKYRESNPENRILMMMNNYVCFPKMLKRMEKKLEYKIITEREYLASKRRQMTDVKVQTSGTSDKTAGDAIFHSMLEDAIADGALDNEFLGGIENSQEYKNAVYIIKVMRRDYILLNDTIESLSDYDMQLFRNYLVRQMGLRDAAEADNMSYAGYKKKIARIKRYIIDDMIGCLELSFRLGA